MKSVNKIAFQATLLFGVAIVFTACQTADQKVAAANENLTDAKIDLALAQQDSSTAYMDSVADCEASKTRWEAEISTNDKNLAEYKAEISAENDAQRENDEKRRIDMEKTNNSFKATMADYKEDGKVSWRKFKTGFNKDTRDFEKDMTAFGQSIKHLVNRKDTN